ncbi:MAG: hypothetical protein M3315_06355 [Actinomycetota bacterium]|nr:hypothetical protein [Actinomycetota bacterium]
MATLTRQERLEFVAAELKKIKRDTTLRCSRLVRTAHLPLDLQGEALAGYQRAQEEFADMLQAVAEGRLTSASVREYLAGERETPLLREE